MVNEKNKNTSDSNNSAIESNNQNDRSPKKQITDTGLSTEKESTGGPVNNVLSQAKDSAGEMYKIVADTASSKIDEQKNNISSGLVAIAGSIRQAGETLRDGDEQNAITGLTAKYGQTIADKIEDVSGYFDRKDLKGMMRDVENFARNQPALFIGTAFAAGLLAARFLKSSNRSLNSGSQPTNGTTKTKTQKSNKATDQMASIPA